MKEYTSIILAALKEHGMPLTALGLVLFWVFYLDYQDRKRDDLERQQMQQLVSDLRQEVKDCYTEQIKRMTETIEKNTHALENLK